MCAVRGFRSFLPSFLPSFVLPEITAVFDTLNVGRTHGNKRAAPPPFFPPSLRVEGRRDGGTEGPGIHPLHSRRATLRAPINIVLTTLEYSAATRDEDLLLLLRPSAAFVPPSVRPSCSLLHPRPGPMRDRPSYLSPESPHQSRRNRLPLSHAHFSGLLRCSPAQGRLSIRIGLL